MDSSLHAFGKTARDLARNPLGIIALFIVFIYAIAALVVGFSKNLPPDQINILILFLVLFPVIVLVSFLWLVVYHNGKLYSPKDFREDDAFLQTLLHTYPVAVSTTASQTQIMTSDVFQVRKPTEDRRDQRRTRLKFELVPRSTAITEGDTFEICAKITGLSAGEDPTLGGFTLIILWNVRQLEFVDIVFSNELGDERSSNRRTTILSAGIFNPADPDFAAILFSNYSDLPREELMDTQSSSPLIASLTFKSLTDGPIRLNAGFPYAANSLIDAERRPSFQASVSALFLNAA